MYRYWNLIEHQNEKEENNLHQFRKISKDTLNGR